MTLKGNGWNYFVNGESKTYEDVKQFIDSDMTVSISGFDVHFVSPKSERIKIAEKFKEEALNKIGVKNIGCKSQSYHTDAEGKENIKREVLNMLFGCKLAEPKQYLNGWSEPNQIELLAELARKIKNSSQKVKKEELLAKKNEMKRLMAIAEDNLNPKPCNISRILKEADKHQEQNGGRVTNMEFPFDAVLTPTREEREQEVIKDWNSLPSYVEFDIPGYWITHADKLSGDIDRPEKFTVESDKKIGKKESKTVEKAPIFTYCKQMKNAVEALALRSLYGHKKYEKGDDWENFSRVENGEFEYSNASFRHALGIGNDEDEEQHLVAQAWNAVSLLELFLRKKKK